MSILAKWDYRDGQRAQVFPDLDRVAETSLVHDQLQSPGPDRWRSGLLEEFADQIELPVVAVLHQLPVPVVQNLPLAFDLWVLIEHRDQHRRLKTFTK